MSRLLTLVVLPAVWSAELQPWDQELLGAEMAAAEPCRKELLETHALHPGMVCDEASHWVVKRALGGLCFNVLHSFEKHREQLHRESEMWRCDDRYLAPEPFEPPQERPEEGWGFWYPDTIPNAEKRESLIVKRLVLEPRRHLEGNPMIPPKDYNPRGNHPPDPHYSPLNPLNHLGRHPREQFKANPDLSELYRRTGLQMNSPARKPWYIKDEV